MRAFRDVLGRFATGVTVVSATDGTRMRGMTANAFTAVSLDPPVVLVCLRLGCATDDLVRDVPYFGVSILSAAQHGVAAWFASPARPPDRAQFDAVGWRPGRVTGTPLVRGAVGWLECAVDDRAVVGDHAVVYGRVLDLAADDHAGAPLVFHRGAFGTVGGPPRFTAPRAEVRTAGPLPRVP